MIGLVTLYNPQVDSTISNILTYLPWLDHLILWDNSPADRHCIRSIAKQLTSYQDKLILHPCSANEFIAPAINFAIQQAISTQDPFLLIMDQDSFWDNFHDFRIQIETLYAQYPNYGAFCPKVDNVYRWISTMPIQPIRLFINSGSVIPTSILSQINGADTRFPLDALDNDLSIRIQQAGFQPVCLTNFHLHHELGHPMRSKILHLYSTNYNASRTYSIIRSYTLFLRIHHKWLNKEEKISILKEYYFWKPIRILCMEPDKWNRFKAYFHGLFDGLKAKK